jgi:hypothetical protein
MSLCIETSIRGGDPALRERFDCFRGTSCVVGALDQPLEMRPYGLAKFGQRRAGQAAVEQWAPQLSLEPFDRVGQRRLRNAATSGRPREVLIAAKRQEISNVTDLHGNRPLCRAADAERNPYCRRGDDAQNRAAISYGAKTGGGSDLFPNAGINFSALESIQGEPRSAQPLAGI